MSAGTHPAPSDDHAGPPRAATAPPELACSSSPVHDRDAAPARGQDRHPHPGLLIVFEGGDGAGKSTQAGLLADWLARQGLTVRRTFQPGDTMIGRHIRRLLLDPASSDLAAPAEALLYAADKAQHIHEVVWPALQRGEIVISDRYVESMVAYQGAGRKLDPADVAALAWWAVGQLRPDLTVLLDVSVHHGLAARPEPDRLEQAGHQFHERVRVHFRQLAADDPDRHVVIDARGSVEQVATAVQQRVAQLLAAHPTGPAEGA